MVKTTPSTIISSKQYLGILFKIVVIMVILVVFSSLILNKFKKYLGLPNNLTSLKPITVSEIFLNLNLSNPAVIDDRFSNFFLSKSKKIIVKIEKIRNTKKVISKLI